MAVPLEMQWNDDRRASDASIADHPEFDVWNALAGRWHKRRQKISGIRHVPRDGSAPKGTSYPRTAPRPLMAHCCRFRMSAIPPLLEHEQTYSRQCGIDVHDPTRTSARDASSERVTRRLGTVALCLRSDSMVSLQ